MIQIQIKIEQQPDGQIILDAEQPPTVARAAEIRYAHVLREILTRFCAATGGKVSAAVRAVNNTLAKVEAQLAGKEQPDLYETFFEMFSKNL